MKAIDRKLLFHLVDVVWSVANEDESVPSTEWAREMIQTAIERRRGEKYSKQKSNLLDVKNSICYINGCHEKGTTWFGNTLLCDNHKS